MTIISTIGPASCSTALLSSLRDAGVEVFRINLSHASVEDIHAYWKLVQEFNLRIALDIEGP